MIPKNVAKAQMCLFEFMGIKHAVCSWRYDRDAEEDLASLLFKR